MDSVDEKEEIPPDEPDSTENPPAISPPVDTDEAASELSALIIGELDAIRGELAFIRDAANEPGGTGVDQQTLASLTAAASDVSRISERLAAIESRLASPDSEPRARHLWFRTIQQIKDGQ